MQATRRFLPPHLHAKARRQLNRVVLAERPADCGIFKDFKMLSGESTYQFRVDSSYRVRFRWENGRSVAIDVGDFHDD